MNILVLNPGSSSIKFTLFASNPSSDPAPTLDGELAGIGTPTPSLEIADTKSPAEASTPEAAIHLVLDHLAQQSFNAIGYRVVHPGPHITTHVRITGEVLQQLDAACAFAPLHNPEALLLIRTCMSRFPSLPHFACFDTVFHQTMPPEAFTFPIPLSFRDAGVRRYGFHGLSCESVVHRMRATPGLPFPQRMIIAHLGSGCSVTALADGKSIDTSMGLTPTGGVVMGTRPGDLDPGLIFFLLRQDGATVASVEHMLNHDSGLKALFGTNDMRKLREVLAQDPNAQLALEIFIAGVRKTIGGFAALHGMDALVFTGGIGEHDDRTRAQLGCGYVHTASAEPEIDFAANQANLTGLRKISHDDTPYSIFVVPADEDLMIARHVVRLAASH